MTWHFGLDGGLWILPIVWLVVVVAFWALVIALIVLAIRWLIRHQHDPWPQGRPPADDPLEILRQRYARGEIDDEEFERRRRTLSGG